MDFILYIHPGILSTILYNSFSVVSNSGLAELPHVLFAVTEISSPQLIFVPFYPILGWLFKYNITIRPNFLLS